MKISTQLQDNLKKIFIPKWTPFYVPPRFGFLEAIRGVPFDRNEIFASFIKLAKGTPTDVKDIFMIDWWHTDGFIYLRSRQPPTAYLIGIQDIKPPPATDTMND